MGRFSQALLEWRAESTTLANPAQWLIDAWGGGPSHAGVSVTPDSAMRASAVFACVRLIAETVGCTPFILYERQPNGGKRRAEQSPVYRVLHESPNRWQTPSEFKETLTGHVLLRGNAFAFIQTDGRGGVQELIPLHPDRVEVFMATDTGAPSAYRYTDLAGRSSTYLPGEIFHLRGLSTDGIMGLALANLGKENIGLALAAEEHASRTFANGASIRGVLQTDAVLKDKAFERLKEQFSDTYSGLKNAGKTAILEAGVKWQSIGMSSKDAEFIELRKFQISDIARIFRVPPHLIGDLDRATFSNIEMQSLEFIIYTMVPWYTKWEEALSRDLFWPADRGRFFVEAMTENLVRGDLKSRYEAYAVGRQNGWLSVNDVRSRENMDPVGAEGDILMAPMNMMPLNQFGKRPPQSNTPANPPDTARKSLNNGHPEAARKLLLDAARRIIAKESFAIRKLSKTPNLDSMLKLLEASQDDSRNILEPLFQILEWSDSRLAGAISGHIAEQIAEIRTIFSSAKPEELAWTLGKLTEDWTELKPELMVNEWNSLEVINGN